MSVHFQLGLRKGRSFAGMPTPQKTHMVSSWQGQNTEFPPPCGSHCSILCILSSHKVALLQLHMLQYHSFRIKLFGTYSMYLP